MIEKEGVSLGKYIARINEKYTAHSFEADGTFDLKIFEEEKEVYYHNLLLYSLQDASKVIRRRLNIRGKRIKWESK